MKNGRPSIHRGWPLVHDTVCIYRRDLSRLTTRVLSRAESLFRRMPNPEEGLPVLRGATISANVGRLTTACAPSSMPIRAIPDAASGFLVLASGPTANFRNLLVRPLSEIAGLAGFRNEVGESTVRVESDI
jgi:hypothetical protein